jgi:MFS family permease
MTTPENTLRVGIPSPGPSFRGALASRDFSLLFIGQLTAAMGNGAVQLALPWLVLKLTDSALQLGLAYFFQFLPMLLFGVLGGVFADRWDRRLTMFFTDLIRAVAFVSVGIIYYLDALTVQHLFAVIFLESTMANFFNPARAALMPNLVKEEDLRAANSLMEVSRHIGMLIFPSVGGLLVAFAGPAAVLFVDGVTFSLSAITVFMIRWRPEKARMLEQAQDLGHAVRIVVQQTADGLKSIARERLLQVSMLLGLSLNAVVAPIQLLLPLFVKEVKHAEADYFGLLVAFLLTGLITGSLTAPGVARRIGLGRMTISAVGVLGVTIIAASWPPGVWPPAIAMLVAGTCIGLLNVAQTTMLQAATTDEDRGRVSATYYTATLGVRPLAFLAMGALAESIDIRYLFVFLGLVAVSLCAYLFRLPEVREHT